jgi:hypothetical protein
MEINKLIKMCLNEIYSKVHIGKHMSDALPIQNGLKQGDALSPLLFKFALECHWEGPRKESGTGNERTHQHLVYADNVNLLGESKNTIKKNAEALLDAKKEISFEVNTEETKNMFMSFHKTVGQNHNIKAANKSFENVANFKYLGMITNQNCVHKEIKSALNLRNVCYHAAQNIFSSLRYLEEEILKYSEL